MKQRTTALILSLLLVLGLTACGSKEVTVDLNEVRAEMLETQNPEEPWMLETDALKNLYGIEAEDVAQSASYVTMSGTFPDEVILVQAVDEKAAERIQSALSARLSEVMVQSQNYDPDNYAAAQKCTVSVDGTYVALILSPDQEALRTVYGACFAHAPD